MPHTSFQAGQHVRLVPTQGGYQKPRTGTVVRVTAQQVLVQPDDGHAQVRYRAADGMPVNKIDQGFPYYVLRSMEQAS